MFGIEVPLTASESETKIRNKLTGKAKSYMAHGVAESPHFIQLEHTDLLVFKTFPKILYDILKERDLK